jgi:hypothetical protein
MILQFVTLAEKLYSGIKGKGAVKKELVMAGAQVLVSDMTAVSTGGQKETWETIAPRASEFVDMAVALANDFSPGIVTDDAFEVAKFGITP